MTSIATILNDNPSHAKIFEISGKISAKTGIPSYVVGGYVRDALLNRETNDIDIICSKFFGTSSSNAARNT